MRIPPPEVLERLNLSDAQWAKLDDLLDGERRRTIKTEGDIRIAELDLHKLVEGDKPEAAAIDEAVSRLNALRGDMLKARVATIIAFRALLTPDQRSKLRRPSPGVRWH